MNAEDEEFNRIEREAKMRMEAVRAALDHRDALHDSVVWGVNRKPWVGLTDDEYQAILDQLGDAGLLAFFNLIENKLKEKNLCID